MSDVVFWKLAIIHNGQIVAVYKPFYHSVDSAESDRDMLRREFQGEVDIAVLPFKENIVWDLVTDETFPLPYQIKDDDD